MAFTAWFEWVCAIKASSPLKRFIYLIFMCMGICMVVHHTHAWIKRGRFKEASDSLELELQGGTGSGLSVT